MRFFRFIVIVLLFLAVNGLDADVFGQKVAKPVSTDTRRGYKIFPAERLRVMTTVECSAEWSVSVYVSRKHATEKLMENLSRRIFSSYKSTESVTIFFSTDWRVASDPVSVEDEVAMGATRGISTFEPKNGKTEIVIRHLPQGLRTHDPIFGAVEDSH